MVRNGDCQFFREDTSLRRNKLREIINEASQLGLVSDVVLTETKVLSEVLLECDKEDTIRDLNMRIDKLRRDFNAGKDCGDEIAKLIVQMNTARKRFKLDDNQFGKIELKRGGVGRPNNRKR